MATHPSRSSSGIETAPGLAHAREIRVKITVKMIDQANLPSQNNYALEVVFSSLNRAPPCLPFAVFHRGNSEAPTASTPGQAMQAPTLIHPLIAWH
jgi:hypothetical protein